MRDMRLDCLLRFSSSYMDGMHVRPLFSHFSRTRFKLTWIRWHVLTAIGGYIAVAVVDLVTSDEVVRDPTELLAWPVPLLARLMTGSAAGQAPRVKFAKD